MAKNNYNNGFNNNNTNDLISFVSREGGYAPPQAIDMEEAILGAVMIEKEAVHDIVDILRAEAFYIPEHQKIYAAVLKLYNELQPVDIYTVGDMLKRSGELEEIGGASKLAQLTNRVGSASHVEYHAKIVAQKYIQRELIRSSIEIQKNSFDENLDVTDLIDFAEGKIFKVSEGFVRRDVRNSYDILKEAMKAIEKAGENKGGINGVPTGFRDLDRLTSGWQPSDLVIIAARPSMGKTAFVLSIARNATIDYQTPVALFSLEMNDIQLITRLIVSESELDSLKIKNGDLTKNEWKHLEKSTVDLSRAPLFIDDTPALSIFEFRSKARRLKAQHNIKLIIIDYLQLMTGPTETRGNREQEVASISRALKAIAKELNVPIIALSQLNRSVETRGGNKRPQLSDLRESGAIEQDADIVAFIHRPEYYGIKHDEDNIEYPPGTAEIIVAKHRNGSVEDVRLRFIREKAKFVNMDDVPSSGSDMYAPQEIASQGFDAVEDFESQAPFL